MAQPQQLTARRASHSGASCSRPWTTAHAPPCAVRSRCRGRAMRLEITARARQPQRDAPKVVYVPNLLEAGEAAAVLREARSLVPQLRRELNCIAVKRQGCFVPQGSELAATFRSKAIAARLTQLLRAPFPLFLSDFPIELRSYPRGAEMPWHLDEQLFASPQWELIYTLHNDSDSRTEWRDASGETFSCWTEPNSLLAVEAEGWEHRVLPVKKGSRMILKMAFTSTSMKLPAFETNLTREAFSAY